jgi:hypothetical protein
MYCTYCNHLNAEGNKFCEACVKPLNPVNIVEPVAVRPVVREQKKVKKSSWLRRLPSIGALVVLVCFFLPWVMVSCTLDVGATRDFGYGITGFEIASGSYPIMDIPEEFKSGLFGISTDPTPSDTEPYPWLVLIPLMGIIGLFSLNGRVSGTILAIISGVLGILGILAFTLMIIYTNSKISISGFRLQFQSGIWGTWIGLLWQTITSFLTLR